MKTLKHQINLKKIDKINLKIIDMIDKIDKIEGIDMIDIITIDINTINTEKIDIDPDQDLIEEEGFFKKFFINYQSIL